MTENPEHGAFRIRPFITHVGGAPGPDPTRSSTQDTEPANPRANPPVSGVTEEFAPRPYLLTAGRVRPVTDDLELEAQVITTEAGRRVRDQLTFEHRDIVDVCATPRSVAEIAAMLGLHLGVTRILAADAAALGYLNVVRPEADWGRRPELIERVIRGLNAIS